MDNVSLVQVQEAVEQLVCQGFEDRHGDWGSERLSMMVNNLLYELRVSHLDLLRKHRGRTRKSCSAYSKTI